MLETTVLPIEYNEQTEQLAIELKEILERNQMLFQMFLAFHKKISFLDSEEDDTLAINSIEEFKELLSSVIPAYLDILKKQVYEERKEDIEPAFLKMMLLNKVSSKDNQEIINNINAIYTIVGLNYYDNPQELLNFIFNPTEEEKQKIFEWYNKKHRYDLMNMLLEDEYQNILELEDIENDSYLRTHLEELLELSEMDLSERFKVAEEEIHLPTLTTDELDKLCIEFFIQIDPSLKWLKIYNELKQNNNILYGEEFIDPCSKWGCVETTDNVYIYAPLSGDISDFMYLIHEFVHCITLLNKQKGECIPSSLQEFPSIFFERLATLFLRNKGYSDLDVTNLEEQRINATLGNKSDISPSLRYLIDYLTKGPITFEREKEKMDRIREAIPDDLPEEMQELLNTLMATEDHENVHTKIDTENLFLVEHPDCIFSEYPYVLGSHLADQTLERLEEEPMLIYTILSLTENLTRENYATATKKIGLVDSLDTKENKQYKK